MRALSARIGVHCVAAVTVLLATATAYAHPDVDAGERAYQSADFSGALDAFERALASPGLRRDDLVRLLATRSLVYYATDRPDQAREDLLAVLSLEPEHAPPHGAPPAYLRLVTDARAASSGALALRLDHDRARGAIRVQARVEHDVASLARAVRISYRRPGEPWQRTRGDAVELPARPGERIDVYAEALGPADLVLASNGSAAAPVAVRAEPLALSREPAGGTTQDDGSDVPLWIWIAGGVALAAAAATVAIVLVTSGDPDVEVGGPRLAPP